MRGEETQLLGALRLKPELTRGRHLFCLPGTHTKWALVENGVVVRFQTALSGELFALLAQHSVLARNSGTVRADNAAFFAGATAARGKAGLLLLLFSTRSRQLNGEIAPEEAASYLSGLITDTEIQTALRLFRPDRELTLVGTPGLTALYESLLVGLDFPPTVINGDDAVLAGLASLHSSLFGASP